MKKTRMKAASRGDWKVLPMSEMRGQLRVNRAFSQGEMKKLRMGVIPEAMEDKWFIFFEDDHLYFHRSWTGHCMYIVRFEPDEESARIASVEVCRDPNIYQNADNEYDVQVLLYLIDCLLLAKADASVPQSNAFSSPVLQALHQWGVFGKTGFRDHDSEKHLSQAFGPPLERSYWVVPGFLLAGYYAGDKDKASTIAKLRSLLAYGVRTFIDLTHPADVDYRGQPLRPYVEELESLATSSRHDVSYQRIPVRDLAVPSRGTMKAILDAIDMAILRKQPVYLHCWGGRGRTGTVVGCFLARHGMATGDAALGKLRELRQNDPTSSQPSPDNKEQREFIRSWGSGE